MILLIDNYDSFAHNLARYFTLAGHEVRVVRNDALTIAQARALNPSSIVISPGPCTPHEAGISNDLICELGPQIPVLGVCLGHQCIGQVFGGRVVRAAEPMHGMASPITHDGQGIFEGLPQGIEVGRYHSLVVELPADTPLRVTARTGNTIMALQHEHYLITGVQFHPESILTPHGMEMVRNFLSEAKKFGLQRKAA